MPDGRFREADNSQRFGFTRYPLAKKDVENRHGFYEKYYKPRENCTVFELPDQEGNAEYYTRRLVEAGFHVQDVEAQ